MRARLLSAVASTIDGRLAGNDVEVTSVVVDSRKASAGALFFALPGERTDGHAFIRDAFARGAAAAVVRDPAGASGSAVVVDDVGEALLRLAADERAAQAAKLVGITGSTGKTSTKDLAAAVLAMRFGVEAAAGSYNNEIGLPLTILGATGDVEVIVAEMGSRGIGHIARLADVARPDVGVVTTIGVAHMGMFGSREAIAEAKAELIRALPDDGVAVLPQEDPAARGFAHLTGARVVTFGRSPDAAVRGEDVILDERGRGTFTLVVGDLRERVELAVPGDHMVTNALAAAATGVALGVSAAECAAALKGARISPSRMETFTTADGVEVVNDAYNANPESMAAGLKAARWMARGRRMIVVLGHMAELGPISFEEHERIGELLARIGVEHLVTVGEEAEDIARAAVREGVEPENVTTCPTAEEALGAVRARARPGDLVFLKASRIAGLERIAEAMR